MPTERALELWPAVYALLQWGERHYAADGGPRRLFAHAECGADLDATGRCPDCGRVPGPAEIVMRPGPGRPAVARSDGVSRALRGPTGS